MVQNGQITSVPWCCQNAQAYVGDISRRQLQALKRAWNLDASAESQLRDTDYFILHMEPGRKGRDWESQASLVRVLFPEAGKTINKVGMLML